MGSGIFGSEILPVGGDPIFGNILLRGREIEVAFADERIEVILECVFGMGIPGNGSVGLGHGLRMSLVPPNSGAIR